VTSSGVPNEVAQAAIRRIWNKEIGTDPVLKKVTLIRKQAGV